MKRMPVLLLTLSICVSGQLRLQQPAPRTALAGDIPAAHNAVRNHARVPRLTWSDELAASSQVWASHLLARGEFAHTPHPAYGENLYEITGARATSEQVVRDWADEAQNYNYQSNTCRGVCGHYTQIVWADTRLVGCAVARNQRTEVWVCHYDPPGNVNGRRPW